MQGWRSLAIARAAALGLAFLIGASASAEDHPYTGLPSPPPSDAGVCNPGVQGTGTSLPDLDDVLRHQEWFAADDDDVRNAPCHYSPPTSDQMREWFADSHLEPTEPRVTRTVHGVELRNQPEALVTLFERLTTTRHRNGEGQAAISVPAGCHEYWCAANAVFGEGMALRLSYLLARHGFNASHLAGDDFSGPSNYTAFTEGELDDVIAGAADTPEHLRGLLDNQPINRFARGATRRMHAGNSPYGDASIALFDPWESDLSHELRQYVVVHEAAHNIGRLLRLDESPGWLAASGWVREGNDWVAGCINCFASTYAPTNPAEDFAESVVAYRYNPRLLAAMSPEKYLFLKELVFDGVEYTTLTGCLLPNRMTRRLAARASRDVEEVLSHPESFAERGILRACGPEVLGHFAESGFGGQVGEGAMACLGRGALAQGLLARPANLSGVMYREEYLAGLARSDYRLPMEDHEAAISEAVRLRIRSDIRAGFRRRMVDGFTPTHEFRRSTGLTPAAFCSESSVHSYQEMTELAADLDSNAGRSSSQVLFAQRERIAGWMENLCLRVYGGRSRLERPSEASIEAALDTLFGVPPAPRAPRVYGPTP